ncbi:MAG: DUF2167 domain-containing protein [Alphaproteobacteria bacterium]|nr:DUF2167 domain-containing protein [Alphaproteobacteria bacterium]
MKQFIAAICVALSVLLWMPPGFAEGPSSVEAAQRAELEAAWKAASKTGIVGPSNITLLNQATLKLPAGRVFVPKAEGARVLRAMGNVVHDQSFVGLIVSTEENVNWLVTVKYIKEGYIKDDDARHWNADDLLSSIKDGVEESNKDRVRRGFAEMQVIGWVESPAYDSRTHRLVWSLLGKEKGEPDSADKNINYNTYALGREGYFSLNLVTTSSRIANDKAEAHQLLAALFYNDGKRYDDFNVATDQVAAYGLVALVGGAAVAKKLGLFALVGAFLAKFAKLLFVGAAVAAGGVAKLFGRKPRDGEA